MTHNYSIFLIGLLLLFVIYRRVRRNIGFQVLRSRRMIVRAVIFMVIGVLLLVASSVHPIAYISDAGGILLGLILAYFAIRTTQFQWRDNQWVYRPNAWVGSAVIVLFFARIVFSFYIAFHSGMQASQSTSPFANNPYMSDPWTEGIIFILFAYYPCYFLFLIRKERHLELEHGQ